MQQNRKQNMCCMEKDFNFLEMRSKLETFVELSKELNSNIALLAYWQTCIILHVNITITTSRHLLLIIARILLLHGMELFISTFTTAQLRCLRTHSPKGWQFNDFLIDQSEQRVPSVYRVPRVVGDLHSIQVFVWQYYRPCPRSHGQPCKGRDGSDPVFQYCEFFNTVELHVSLYCHWIDTLVVTVANRTWNCRILLYSKKSKNIPITVGRPGWLAWHELYQMT